MPTVLSLHSKRRIQGLLIIEEPYTIKRNFLASADTPETPETPDTPDILFRLSYCQTVKHVAMKTLYCYNSFGDT